MKITRILIFAGYYLPGYKAGGPIRSLENMVSHLGSNFDFWIITSDRDLGDDSPYPNITLDKWQNVGKAKVFYAERSTYSFAKQIQLVHDCAPDFLYFNSFFDSVFTIKPLLLWRLRFFSKNLLPILAPRGEFATGALAIKPLKKNVYLFVAKLIGLCNGITWQTSSLHEAQDLKKWTGENVDIRIASNLPGIIDHIPYEFKTRATDTLKVVCVARIARNKNILESIKILREVQCKIEFHLYGPIEDLQYWHECEVLIRTMPPQVKVFSHGQIEHNEISETLKKYDLFFLPTAGENFGHAIFEAFRAGIPALISNRTPWRDLEKNGIGWDVALENETRFREILEECAVMSNEQYQKIQNNIHAFINNYCNDEKVIAANKALFIK
jgi:glycosyltransferase involved in cell wall biosynthesis